jgi:hypothetical protein
MVPPINLHGRLLLQNLYGKQGKSKIKESFSPQHKLEEHNYNQVLPTSKQN